MLVVESCRFTESFCRDPLALILPGHQRPPWRKRDPMTPQWFKAFRLDRQHREKRQRVARYFDCTWQSEWGPQRSRVSSLSPTGCYIEDRFTVPPSGEVVPELTVSLPNGQICVQGTVMDAMPGIGFAVRFTQVDADTKERLSAAVKELRQGHAEF